MNDISDEEKKSVTPKKKRGLRNELSATERVQRHRNQKYRKAWEENPVFQKWLMPDKNSNCKAKCRVCQTSMTAEIGVLKKHAASTAHVNKMQAVRGVKCLFSSTAKVETPLNVQTKTAEIKLCAFFVEHNIPFLAMDHFSEVLSDCFHDSAIAKGVRLKRTKSTAIVKNVIAIHEKDLMTERLKQCKFSILTDESTDIGTVKTACVVVRFFDKTCGKIVSKFWDLSNVFDSYEKAEEGATGENLFQSLLKTLKSRDVPEANVIGFGSDGCPTMMGCNNSVASRMRKYFPGIFIMTCVCHSLHLVASNACKVLPKACEQLARDIFNFFSASGKRQAQFREFQEFAGTPLHKILHPSQTRWLSLTSVIERILEQWCALQLFFDKVWLEERLSCVDDIQKALHDPFMKLYFLFLKWVLPKFTKINECFQSSKVVITKLHSTMVAAYQDLLMCFMERKYVLQTNLMQINIEACDHKLPHSQMYLGVEVQDQLKHKEITKHPHLLEDFYSKVQKFFQNACLRLKDRYDFNDTLLPHLALLDPKRALSHVTRETNPSLTVLTRQLKRIVPDENVNLQQKIDDQWRPLPLKADELSTEIPDIRNLEPDIFWAKLKEVKNESDEGLFPDLSEFALAALSLPHANADCERIFSAMNSIKVEKRNKLKCETVSACLLAKQAVQSTNCTGFKPTNEMLKHASSLMYSKVDEEDLPFEID